MTSTDWADRNAAWWAKLDHAKTHLATLTTLVNAYKAENPVRVEKNPSLGSEGEIGYVLRIDKPVSVAISLVVGDVLHNLRSGLDAVVYGMVEEDLGSLTNKQARACKFPICLTPDAFGNVAVRDMASVWSERLRYALHGAQPYYHEEQARKLGIPLSRYSYEDLSRLETIWGISCMNNIDKHRRIAVTAWWPSIVYWFLPDGCEPQNWRPGDGTFNDGSIVGYASGGGVDGPQEVRHEFNLVLTDLPTHSPNDPTSSTDVLATVGTWVWAAESIVGEVIRSWVHGPRP